jgi:hypothetical protein
MSKINVTVSGETGSGKSAIAGEIEIAMKAIGVPVFVQERDTMVHADYMHWIDLYKPEVTIFEQNIPIPAHQTELAMGLKPLEPLLPGEARSEYLDRLERGERKPHKTMTPEEYAAMTLKGWHEVCRDVDGFGGVGIRYLGGMTEQS